MGAGRVLGLDIGTRRIGVALSDETRVIASPQGTIHISQETNSIEKSIEEIVTLVNRHGVRRVVAGLPRNMKGERGVQAQWTEEFVARLGTVLEPYGVYISFVDERLTTAQAARTFEKPSGRARPPRPAREGRASLDARAAALILQGYLDQQHARRAP